MSVADTTAPVRSGERVDIAKLAKFLRGKLPGSMDLIEVRQFPGGHSNLTYLIKAGTHEWVLRRPPFGSKVKSAHDMSREFRVLSRLNYVFPKAPEPLVYCDDHSVIGAPFY